MFQELLQDKLGSPTIHFKNCFQHNLANSVPFRLSSQCQQGGNKVLKKAISRFPQYINAVRNARLTQQREW